MRKISALILLLLLMTGVSYGAVSEDVYVRKDVFEAKMEAFMGEIRLMNEQLRSDIRALETRIVGVEQSLNSRIGGVEQSLNSQIGGVEQSLNSRIDGVEQSLNSRIGGEIRRVEAKQDGLEARMGDLRNDIYLGFVLLGIIIAWPRAREVLQKIGKTAPSVTLEDVRRLIEENNVKLRGSSQV